jgi:hypothetical protein
MRLAGPSGSEALPLAGRVGVGKVKLHRFSQTFATWAIENEARELDAQYPLGRSTLATLRRYSSTYDAEKAARAHERFSPADEMGDGWDEGRPARWRRHHAVHDEAMVSPASSLARSCA